ncbi:hypothetical protein [Pedobacter sp. Leaf250]|uniref:hypothetical protein n=1 Tax=Pedobacter sp. Leaf250 TaxID=2876559 RepID=UPI001E473FF7|nr:hypothetical protein [Pedobacter sp. Leaf250]
MKNSNFNLKGILAFAFSLVMVAGLSAFKPLNQDASKRLRYNFYYSGPATATQMQVENPANWATGSPQECGGGEDRPCSIEVDEAYVNPGSTPTLKSNINLSTAQSALHSTYYVDGADDSSISIDNKAF